MQLMSHITDIYREICLHAELQVIAHEKAVHSIVLYKYIKEPVLIQQ